MTTTNTNTTPDTFLDIAEMGRGAFIIFRVAGPVRTPGDVVGRVGSPMKKAAAFKAVRAEAARTGETVTCAGRTI